jgi:hypothetical protein
MEGLFVEGKMTMGLAASKTQHAMEPFLKDTVFI